MENNSLQALQALLQHCHSHHNRVLRAALQSASYLGIQTTDDHYLYILGKIIPASAIQNEKTKNASFDSSRQSAENKFHCSLVLHL